MPQLIKSCETYEGNSYVSPRESVPFLSLPVLMFSSHMNFDT